MACNTNYSNAVNNAGSPSSVQTDDGFFAATLDTLRTAGDLLYYAANYFLGNPNLDQLRGAAKLKQLKAETAFKELTTEGKFGNFHIWDLNETRKNQINSILAKARFINSQFKNRLKTHIGKGTPEIAKALDEILKNPDLLYRDDFTLPDGRPVDIEVVESMREMRGVIDSLSRELMDAGVVDGDLATIIANNMGIYVGRQYRIHFDENWIKLVTKYRGADGTFGKSRVAFSEQLQNEATEILNQQTFANDRLSKLEFALNNSSDPNQQAKLASKISFWEKRITELGVKMKRNLQNQKNIDAYILAYLEDHRDVSSTAGVNKARLGGKNEGVLTERAKSIKNPKRKIVNDKLKRVGQAILKTQKVQMRIERALMKERGSKGPVPLKLRDKKVLLQARRSKLKSRATRRKSKLNKQTTPDPQLQAEIKTLDAKIADLTTKIDDLTQQIAFERSKVSALERSLDQKLEKLILHELDLKIKERELHDELNEINQLDIPKPIRDLLGEVEDPSINFITTVHKQIHLLENHKFTQSLVENGLGKIFFEDPPDEKYIHKINFKDSDPVGPVKELYTSKDIKDALENYNASARMNQFYLKFSMLSSQFKMNLTVLYHLVGLRNLFGAAYSFQATQGDFGIAVASLLNWMFMDGNAIGITMRAMGIGKNWGVNPPTGRSMIDKAAGALGGKKQNLVSQYLNQLGLAIVHSVGVDKKAIHDINKSRQLTFGVDVWNLTPEELKGEYEQAHRLGLFDEDFTIQPFKDAVERLKGEKPPEGISGPVQTGLLGKTLPFIPKAAKTVWNKSKARYQSSDNAGRYLRYRIESAKLARSVHGKPLSELDPDEQLQIEREAAEIAKSLYPTISRVPPFVKELSKFPLLGDFVTFPVSMAMVQAQTIRRAMVELRTPTKASIGMQRLLGVFGTNALTMATIKSIAALATGLYDDEEKEGIRESLPEWSRGSMFIAFKSYDSDGNVDPNKIKYIDAGPQLPGTTYARLISLGFQKMMGRKGKYVDVSEQFGQTARGIIGTFTDPSITFARFEEAYRNRRDITKDIRIVPDAESGGKHLIERTGYALGITQTPITWENGRFITRPMEIETGGLVPGTFGMMQRTIDAIKGTPTKSGTFRDPTEEAIAWLIGTRISTTEMDKSMRYRHKSISTSVSQLESDWRYFTKQSRFVDMPVNKFWSDKLVKSKVLSIQQAYNRQLLNGMRFDQIVMDQGLGRSTANEVLDKAYSRFQKSTVNAIKHKRYVPFNFTIKGKGGPDYIDLPESPNYIRK